MQHCIHDVEHCFYKYSQRGCINVWILFKALGIVVVYDIYLSISSGHCVSDLLKGQPFFCGYRVIGGEYSKPSGGSRGGALGA